MSEQKTVIFENDRMRVERIQSVWYSSPTDFWYDQPEDEWVQVTRGSAVLEFEKSKVELKAGSNIYIKARERHRIAETSSDCEWLCVFIKGKESENEH